MLTDTMEKEKKSGVCRVCLDCDPDETVVKCLSIFEVVDDCPIYDMIKALASVTIEKGDGMPDLICPACLLDLETAYNFKLLCESTNQVLLSAQNAPIKLGDGPKNEKFLSEDDKSWSEDKLIKEDFFHDDDGGSPEEAGAEYFDENTTLEPLVVPKLGKAIDLKLICHDCGGSFPSKCKIRTHWKKIHMSEKLKCLRCLRQFKTYTAFNRHQKNRSTRCIEAAHFHTEGEGKNRTYHCKQCNYKCQRIYRALHHLVVHTGERRFQCKICQKRFQQSAGLRRHATYVHLENLVIMPCSLCGKQFPGQQNLTKHMKRVHSSERFSCKLCNAILKTKESLKVHLNAHTGINKYTCEVCAKAFISQSNFINHRRVHGKSENVKFTCDICQFTSHRENIIRKHKKKHSPTNTACNVCGKFLENNLQLLLHKERHTERNYQCALCDKTYHLKKNLYCHIRSKHRTKLA